MGYSIVRLDEIEPAGPGGAVRFVRRELGVKAFGINWFELPPNAEGHEHDETGSGFLRFEPAARSRYDRGSQSRR